VAVEDRVDAEPEVDAHVTNTANAGQSNNMVESATSVQIVRTGASVQLTSTASASSSMAQVCGLWSQSGHVSQTSSVSQTLHHTISLRYAELLIATDQFNVSNIIGKGGYAIVYRGEWKHTTIAVKRIVAKKPENVRCSLCCSLTIS
jgi:hypothetical protein